MYYFYIQFNQRTVFLVLPVQLERVYKYWH